MKQNMQTIYLQISTAQGPAECRNFGTALARVAPMDMRQPRPPKASAQKLVYRRFPHARYA